MTDLNKLTRPKGGWYSDVDMIHTSRCNGMTGVMSNDSSVSKNDVVWCNPYHKQPQSYRAYVNGNTSFTLGLHHWVAREGDILIGRFPTVFDAMVASDRYLIDHSHV